MRKAIQGLPLRELLVRFLDPLGEKGLLLEVNEILSGNPSLSEIREVLRRQGYQVREVKPVAHDLGFLGFPALLWEGPDTGCILLGRVGKNLRILDAEGERNVPFALVCESFEGSILEFTEGFAKKRKFFRLLGPLLTREKKVLLQVGLASLGIQLLALAMPQFTRIAMDRAMPEGGHSLLGILVLGLVLVAFSRAWIGLIREQALMFLESKVDSVLSRGFLSHLLSLPFPFLNGKTLGELLQAQGGLDAARRLLTERLVGVLVDGALAVLYLVVMAASLGAPTLFVLVVSLLVAGISALIGRMQARIQRDEIEGRAKEQGYLIELLRGIATLKSAGAEALGVRRWLGLLLEWMSLSLTRQRLGLWSEVGLEGIRQFTSIALLIWGGKLVLLGELKIGGLMAFLQMAGGFMGAVLGLAQAYIGLEVLRPQLERVEEILEVDPEPLPLALVRSALGPVILEDVWFRYREDLPWILKGYNLRVEPGEKCWLRAPSGFGKSTLLRLISGLYLPQRGAISIGSLKPAEVRSCLVYLPQFIQLYGGSVIENLRLLSGNAARNKIMEAAEYSGLDAMLSEWPMGYETLLPQGGGTLSGGQRQLVALTAVMASDRPLLLLDEAMANLDSLRRSSIAASPWFEGRTLIYASHDAGLGVQENHAIPIANLPEGPSFPIPT